MRYVEVPIFMDIQLPPQTLWDLMKKKELMELPQPQSREVAEEGETFISVTSRARMLPLCDIVEMLTDNDGQPEEFSSDEEKWQYAVMVTKAELSNGKTHLTFASYAETEVSERVVR